MRIGDKSVGGRLAEDRRCVWGQEKKWSRIVEAVYEERERDVLIKKKKRTRKKRH